MKWTISCVLFAWVGFISDFAESKPKSKHFLVKDDKNENHLIEIEDGKVIKYFPVLLLSKYVQLIAIVGG